MQERMIPMNNKVSRIDFNQDIWTIQNDNNHHSDFVFYFEKCPNDWFKNTVKSIVQDSLSMKKSKTATIHRYNVSLHKFYEFLEDYNLDFNTLEPLTNNHIEMFIFYLQQQGISKSTTSTALSSLKWLIKHGRRFNYDGFPKHEVFSGEEFKMLKIEDTLKSKVIPQKVILQIEQALKHEENILVKSLIEIGIDTGIRLNECLQLTNSSISLDLTDKPILHVVSEKNLSERFIPVSNRVKRAVSRLNEVSKEAYCELNTDCLFVYKNAKNDFVFLSQGNARHWLKKFVKNHDIKDSNGELYPLHYHAFRHTLGTSMLNKGMSIFEIQDYLGHESLHSTSIYAKIQNPTLHKKYNELGFIGKIIEEPNALVPTTPDVSEENTLLTASLPDGICSKPIDNQGKLCAKYNMCLLCPKFITTPQHLDIHKNHLERIKSDMAQYMRDEYIGSLEHIEKIEFALEAIISQLEEIQNGTN